MGGAIVHIQYEVRKGNYIPTRLQGWGMEGQDRG